MTKHKTNSRRGVAMILTLAVSFFLLVLLGAFVIVHRGSNSLTVSGQKRQKAYNACLSGLHFLWGELELNPFLGAGALPDGQVTRLPAGSPKIEVTYHGEEPEPDELPDIETNYIEGKILGTSDTFLIRYVNNLENRSAAEDTQLGTVPARCAKIQVEGTSSGVTLKLESVLRRKPFVDYSMLSNNQMSVELDPTLEEDKWFIGSEDPYINQVRSNDEILGPSALDHDLLFQGPPRGGVAKATNDIVLDGQSVKDDPDFLVQSEKNAKGAFQVGTATVDVPGLKREDLRLPNNAINLQGGDLMMRQVEEHEWVPQQFQVDTDLPPDGIPDTTITRYRERVVSHNAVQYGNNLWVGNSGYVVQDDPLTSHLDGHSSPGSDGLFPRAGGDPLPTNVSRGDDYPYLYNSAEARVQADLTTGDIAFSPGSKFQFNGDFSVIREEAALRPTLLMGYELNPGHEPRFAAGDVSPEVAAESPELYSTALITSGSLNLAGPVSGYGTLFADQNVSLRARPTLSADPVMAVALHGEAVEFVVEEPNSDDKKSRTYLETDWEVFQEGLDRTPNNDGTGYAEYENWHGADITMDSKHRVIGDDPDSDQGVRYNKVGLTGREAADALAQEFGLTPQQMPNFNLGIFSGWNGGNSELSLEQYVGLREYLRKPDAGNRNSWITLENHGFMQITAQIRRQIEFYSQWSRHMNLDMDEFMAQPELKIADVYFVGLVHAGEGGFRAEADDFSMFFEGALVSQGGIDIKDTPWAKFIYNRDYLDDVIKRSFTDPLPLDQVYFRLN